MRHKLGNRVKGRYILPGGVMSCAKEEATSGFCESCCAAPVKKTENSACVVGCDYRRDGGVAFVKLLFV